MKRNFIRAVLCAAVLTSGGCSNNGAFIGTTLTNVELSEGNYKIVAMNVSGESWSSYILGFSISAGALTQTFALVRVGGDGMFYKAAFEDLWKNFEKQHGSPVGRKLALVNVRYDSDVLNLFLLFSGVKIYVRADVIEFMDEK